jgi:hypothetical protein
MRLFGWELSQGPYENGKIKIIFIGVKVLKRGFKNPLVIFVQLESR